MTDDRPGLHLAPPPGPPPKRPRPKVKKLRLLALLIPLALLAGVSTMFGMLMAVAADLPSLEQLPQVAKRKNSVLLDRWGDKLTTLTANDGRVIVRGDQIGPYVKYAVIAIEDQRFYENAGVDLRGTARALYQDVIAGHAAQGGSTIAQQFIKNALKAQQERTLIQKVREAALAYHLTRKWPKDRILTEYLNTVYFGNGAYGVEAAARTYFGADPNHEGCGTGGKMCAAELAPHEAALLGAIIASPSAYDPLAHPEAATRRRNLVLRKMLEQGRITQVQFQESVTQPLTSKVTPPRLDAPDNAEYFVSWVRQNLVDQVGPQRAFEGDLRVYTTLDLQLQKAAEQAVQRQLPYESGPSASLVAIDNQTGEVRAMVGGRDYAATPFNLATQGQRQPGSSIKPFIMAQALREGVSPNSVWPSRKREFCVTRRKGKCVEVFTVNNFEDAYAGSSTLARALTFSDNSVFAAVGLQVGTKQVARLAERMGIRTPVSSNPAMTLGGLEQGVTPLDMAHAYETFATFGLRVSGTLGTSDAGPVGIDKIVKGSGKDAETVEENERRRTRVLSQDVAGQARQLLTGPVQYGSGTRAAFGGFAAGKTGTTENSGDAWFVGFTDRWTIAVWVGYPEGFKPMETEFRGEPVTGGTFPALIWHDFVVAANAVTDERVDKERARKGLPPREETQTTTTPPATVTPAPVEGAAPSQDVGPSAPTTGGTGAGTTGGTGTGGGTETPATPAPAAPATPAVPETPAPTPAPTPTPAPVDPNAGAAPAAGDTGATQAPADPATP